MYIRVNSRRTSQRTLVWLENAVSLTTVRSETDVLSLSGILSGAIGCNIFDRVEPSWLYPIGWTFPGKVNRPALCGRLIPGLVYLHDHPRVFRRDQWLLFCCHTLEKMDGL